MYLPSGFYVGFLMFVEVVRNITELASQSSWTKTVIDYLRKKLVFKPFCLSFR